MSEAASTRPSSGSGRPAVFLDRDGTIIHDRVYLGDPAGVELVPGASESIALLNRARIPVVIITNQSGIGRGYFDEAAFHATQDRLAGLLADGGARVDAVYHCPHAPDERPACDCRKPAPGLFLRAARELNLDLARSVFVGDRLRDVVPAAGFGGTGILIADADARPDLPPEVRLAADLPAAVRLALAALD